MLFQHSTYTGKNDFLSVLKMHVTNDYGAINNNNKYLERLTRTGPKRLHVLYKYTRMSI